ncbi:transcriptional regulator family: Fungal Specific TF [Trichoderma harzianum]|nr:transcriptional regulator family: Fungal Specific TF [Trichoderma harzianum]
MTASTGKRTYRACVRCRRRKTKCDLGGIGEPRKIPCVSCFESDSECVLAESRRGGNFRTYEPSKKSTRSHKASQRTSPRTTRSTEKEVDRSLDGLNEDVIDEQLASELRNPSDALHILAQSEKSKASGSPVLPNEEERDGFLRGPSNVVSVDEYELVQRGLVNHSNISELLHLYSQNYHSYCPIVPAYMFGQSGIDKIRTSDFFLLTVILTIASRDSSNHSLIHRYCWDYTQKLLLEVLLGYPWTLKSRTVESLLLLSEWLPHIELTQSVSNESKSMFIEDRTSWSLVGLAVRQAYLMRLDQGAFPNIATQETKEQAEHKRLLWTFVYIADRQISVRLGQSFWSRGPSLSTRLTAKDFPSLQPANSSQEDYASAHQATMELTQLMHNAQAILYSSPKRTLAMVHDGDYSRYLDDFQRASMNWHATWSDLAVSARVKRSLSLDVGTKHFLETVFQAIH